MRKPPVVGERTIEGTFAEVRAGTRSRGRTGTVETVGDGTERGAVFLNGAAVYARHAKENQTAEDALDSLLSCEKSRVRAGSSAPEAVRMFRTYMRYISDDALITAEPLDGASVEKYEAEGVLVQGVRNTAGGSFGEGEDVVPVGSWTRNSPGAEMPDRSVFPEGVRTALAPDVDSLRRHVAEREATGYAVGDGEVITFQDGELVDKKRVDVRQSVRTDADVASGWVVVDTDPGSGDEKKDAGDTGGLFDRIL